ncbi:MFS transporter [Pseudonocardia alaniniphila]|uniref:MFS transporter n=1 Tax=Pseudonocardia alaniniphila TaxID=75291 RepID=A0ABS9TTE4_9PSEU|nr:MFS transporter [Pseudonocardia alaniniphila]MCH6171772.1 MFS transporter [Pseudonocardia alaniniphila]
MSAVPGRGVTPATKSFRRIGSRATRKATIIAFFAWLFAVFDFIMFGTLLPQISASFGWDDATASLVSTLVSVGTAIIALAVGPITDRIGRRKGMILTVLGTAVASALSSVTPSAAYLIGVRSLGGLGLAEQAVNATYLSEIYAVTDDEKIKKRRGLIYSLVQGAFPLGVLLASAWVAIFLPVIGWRGCFLLAVFPAVVIALMRRGLRESPQFELELQLRRLRKQGRTTEAAELARSYGVDERPAAPLAAIFRGHALRNTLVLGFAWFINAAGMQLFAVLGTTVLTEGKHVSFTNSLVLLIVANAVGYVGDIAHGFLGDRLGRRNVIAFGWITAGVLFAFMLTVANGTIAVVILYSLGLFFLTGAYSAMLFYMGECYDTTCRATGTGFLNAMSQPGSIVAGAIVTAMLASGSTWAHATLLVGAVGTFVSGVVMFGARRAPLLQG